jgi:hypothetical protein
LQEESEPFPSMKSPHHKELGAPEELGNVEAFSLLL